MITVVVHMDQGRQAFVPSAWGHLQRVPGGEEGEGEGGYRLGGIYIVLGTHKDTRQKFKVRQK